MNEWMLRAVNGQEKIETEDRMHRWMLGSDSKVSMSISVWEGEGTLVSSP